MNGTRLPFGSRSNRVTSKTLGEMPAGMNNSRSRHAPAGSTKRGVNGLFEMGANVWEWVADRRGDEALTGGWIVVVRAFRGASRARAVEAGQVLRPLRRLSLRLRS